MQLLGLCYFHNESIFQTRSIEMYTLGKTKIFKQKIYIFLKSDLKMNSRNERSSSPRPHSSGEATHGFTMLCFLRVSPFCIKVFFFPVLRKAWAGIKQSLQRKAIAMIPFFLYSTEGVDNLSCMERE